MRAMLVTLVLLAGMAVQSQASVIAEWDNTSLAGNEETAEANVLASNVASGALGRGAGGTAVGYTNTFALRDSNQSLSLATSLANGTYFEISLEAASEYVLNLTNIFIRLTAQNSGAGNDRIFTLFSDATGFDEGDELATFTVTGTTLTFNADLSGVEELQGVASVEFRLYVHGTGVVGQWDQNGIGHAFWAEAEPPDLRIDGVVTEDGDPGPDPDPEVVIPDIALNPGTGALEISIPDGQTLALVEGATALVGNAFNWQALTLGEDYTVSGGVVSIEATEDTLMIRFWFE